MRTRSCHGLLAALLLLPSALAQPASAQESLYGPQPPAGSAYLRFANALPDDATVTPQFMAVQHLGKASAQRIGPYTVVERVKDRALLFEVDVPGQGQGQQTRSSVRIEPDSFVTIILQPTADSRVQAVTVRDRSDFNQVRTALSFYNAAPGCPAGSLHLDPGGAAIFQNVSPGTAMSRDVQPVEAGLYAACGDARTSPFTLTGLEAGTRFSIWLIPAGSRTEAFAQRDTVLRYKP